MIYLDLLLGFLKVGLFAFGGGYGAVPLIRDVVLSYGWLSEEMLAYMIAVSESTPGPIMVNLATYVGATQAGALGAIIASFAVILPSFIIVIIITALMSKFIKNKYVQAVLNGIKPCITGIILSTGAWMIIKNLFKEQFAEVDYRAVILTVVIGAVYFGLKKVSKKKISPILLIVIGAVAGIIGYVI